MCNGRRRGGGGGGRKLAVSMNEGVDTACAEATRTSTLPIKGPVQVIVGTAANHA